MNDRVRDKHLYDTEDLQGVHIGKDYWPTIFWMVDERRFKHSKVSPWGTGSSRTEPKPGKYQ